jgi:hypothetical protein
VLTSSERHFFGKPPLAQPSSNFAAANHGPEQPPDQMALGQHQPAVPRMLDHPVAGLHVFKKSYGGLILKPHYHIGVIPPLQCATAAQGHCGWPHQRSGTDRHSQGRRVIDPDFVEPSNVSRQFYYPGDLGDYKAAAFIRNLQQISATPSRVLGYAMSFAQIRRMAWNANASGSLLRIASLEKCQNFQTVVAECDGLWIFLAKLYYPIMGR